MPTTISLFPWLVIVTFWWLVKIFWPTDGREVYEDTYTGIQIYRRPQRESPVKALMFIAVIVAAAILVLLNGGLK